MGLPNSRQGTQKVMLLTGFLLSCMLQLAPAQFQQLSLTPEPYDPLVGKDVKLSLKGAPREYVQCQWFRQSHLGRAENIFTHFAQTQKLEKGRGHTGRETLRDGCSLYIARLEQSNAGNYTVVIQVGSDQQTGQGQQFAGRNYSASYYLHISNPISIILNPQRPVQGQDLTLTPQNAPKQFISCNWLIISSGGNEKVLEYNSENGDQQSPSQGRATLRRDCSLQIRQLDTSDTGNYTVRIESHLDQRQQPGQQQPGQQQPGQGTFPQEPEEGDFQVHKGQLYLDVFRQSGQNSQKSRAPASLTYSAAVVAGTLLGSLAWADALTPVFSGLFCSLTSLKRKVVP